MDLAKLVIPAEDIGYIPRHRSGPLPVIVPLTVEEIAAWEAAQPVLTAEERALEDARITAEIIAEAEAEEIRQELAAEEWAYEAEQIRMEEQALEEEMDPELWEAYWAAMEKD